MATPLDAPPQATLAQSLRKWGENSFQPILLAALIAPQHLRPIQPIGGILFPSGLILGSYMSLNGFKKDGAGLVGATSGLYVLLAARRRHRIREKLSPRGVLRGVTLAYCAVNVVGCGLAYAFGDRAKEAEERGV